jgi:hypothetical protein
MGKIIFIGLIFFCLLVISGCNWEQQDSDVKKIIEYKEIYADSTLVDELNKFYLDAYIEGDKFYIGTENNHLFVNQVTFGNVSLDEINYCWQGEIQDLSPSI